MAKKKESIKPEKSPLNETATSPVAAPLEADVKYAEDSSIDVRTVTISLEEYTNIIPFYTMSKLEVKATFMGNTIGESDKIPITNKSQFEDDSIMYKFIIDVGRPAELNKLLSNPVIFTATQYPGKLDSQTNALLEKLELSNKEMSLDSVISMYEAFSEEKLEIIEQKVDAAVDKKGSKQKKGKEKPKKPDNSSKKSASSKSPKKDSSKRSKTNINAVDTPNIIDQPIIIGVSMLDFLPLFYGKETFTETLMINPIKILSDERMITYKNLPSITVKVNISSPLAFESPTIMNFTMESIYNTPIVMNCQNMDYKVCMMIPVDAGNLPVLVKNGVFTTKPQQEQLKCWPGIERIGYNSNTTKYQLDTNTEFIKNRVGEDLATVMGSTKPRVEFNYIHRNILQLKDCQTLIHHLNKYRRVAIEILMSNKTTSSFTESQSLNSKEPKEKGGKGKGKKDKPKEREVASPEESLIDPCFLHLVAHLDLGYLLNPGAKKIRIACPISTFHYKQALNICGLMDSFFIPKPKVIIEPKDLVQVPKEGKKKGKSSQKDGSEKGSKGTKSSKGSKGKKSKEKAEPVQDTNGKNLKEELPPPPPPEIEEEPSSEVYNENGERSFIIVEIELSQPLVEKRDLVDLNESLNEIIPEKPPLRQIAMSVKLAEQYYKGIINQLAIDMNDHYINYIEDKSECMCPTQADFETYLRRIGVYQKLLNSMINAASFIAENKFQIDGNYVKNDKIFQSYVGEIYTYLVSEMNCVLNKCAVSELVQAATIQSLDNLLFYAREATELGAHILAERYYMERLCSNKENPNYWFDYAVYKIQMNNKDKAFECVQEALSKDIKHCNSLLLYGILLVEKQKNEDAETCFLTLLIHEPQWVEAWGVLYLLYQIQGNVDGMELCRDMAVRNLHVPKKETNYIMQSEDLAWSPEKCPDTMFFRTAILLLKMRIYEWTENALAHEIMKHNGLVNYLLAVKSYYKRDFVACREHIELTKQYYGKDCFVASLSGHCYLAMDMLEEAEKDYSFVIASFNRREDIHLVYINYARILGKNRQQHQALKLSLIACKLNPTPYTWLSAGISYYEVNDFLSAEECFTEANMRDNRIGETWAYLTLINLIFHRTSEAEICYQQILKNSLNNQILLQKVEDERKKLLV